MLGKQHYFHYSITLHPYSSTERVSIGDMHVSFTVNRIPFQMTIPGTTIAVGSIPIEDLEISEGYYACPQCGEHLEFDTVLCTTCGFEINQEILQKIWSNHETHTKLIEEETVQRDEPIKAEEKPVQVEEKLVQAELPAKMEVMYLKQAAQSFQEDNCEECLLNLKIAIQIIKRTHPTMLQNANGVVEKLLKNIMEYDGKPVSRKTAATSLKFVINFVKSLRTTANESPL